MSNTLETQGNAEGFSGLTAEAIALAKQRRSKVLGEAELLDVVGGALSTGSNGSVIIRGQTEGVNPKTKDKITMLI